MTKAALPQVENERLEALEQYQILGTNPEPFYDEMTFLASTIADAPMAVISFVAKDRQWFKSKVGLTLEGSPRDVAFCAHAVQGRETLIVEDALLDSRFVENPLVVNSPGIRFYAGVPLVGEDGFTLGALAVLDTVPRKLSAKALRALELVSRHIVRHLEVRRDAVLSLAARDKVVAEKAVYQNLVASLREANELAHVTTEDLRSIFETVPFQIGLVEVHDDNIEVLSANALARREIGIPIEAKFPVRSSDLGTSLATTALWLEKYRESKRLRQPVAFEAYSGTFPNQKKYECSVNRCSDSYSNRFVFVVEDVTEQSRREAAQAEERAKLINTSRLSSLTEMAAGFAHEINNPLAIISALNESLMDDVRLKGENSAAQLNLAKIDRAVNRISQLVAGLKKLGRDGTADPMVEYSVGQVVSDALALCQPRLQIFDITVNFRLPDDVIKAWMQPVPISQALVNVLNNAVEAVAGLEKRIIEIDLYREADHVVVSISDSGHGIHEKHRGRIFDPFFTTRAPARPGIGLSISRGIVEDHGGDLELDLKADRTQFNLKLPVGKRATVSSKKTAGGLSV